MANVDFLHERLGRLKVALRAGKDKEVAEALGLSEKAFNARKARNSFPEKELRALAQQRPELGIDVEYVLTGGTLSQHQRRVYEDITEVLRLCSDDTVELALKLVVKLYRAELAENNSTRGGVMKGEI